MSSQVEAGPVTRRPRGQLAGQLAAVRGFAIVLVVLVVLWEVGKWLAGDPWRYDSFLGTGIRIDHRPPFRLVQLNDLNLPHVWTILGAFGETSARGDTFLADLVVAAFFTLRGSAVGFALGAVVGLALAVVLIHVRVLERGIVPLLVASQTIPIIAIAPLVVVGLKAGWFGVAIVASYLTFFPVTVAAIRGMRAADPRAFELMRSYAAGPRDVLAKLRLPASGPYVFTAFRVSATASVVGAIVGEFPAGIRDGLGGALLTAMQYNAISPERLWAAITVCAMLGMLAFVLVVLAERWALRSYRPSDEGAAA